MSDDLASFVKRNQKFLKLGDGETFTGAYMGFVIGFDPRNPEKEKVTYKFRPDDSEKNVFMSSGSVSLAQRMSKIAIGEVIQLTRHGMGTETSYEINPT